jgi:hypothetical protein
MGQALSLFACFEDAAVSTMEELFECIGDQDAMTKAQTARLQVLQQGV